MAIAWCIAKGTTPIPGALFRCSVRTKPSIVPRGYHANHFWGLSGLSLELGCTPVHGIITAVRPQGGDVTNIPYIEYEGSDFWVCPKPQTLKSRCLLCNSIALQIRGFNRTEDSGMDDLACCGAV